MIDKSGEFTRIAFIQSLMCGGVIYMDLTESHPHFLKTEADIELY